MKKILKPIIKLKIGWEIALKKQCDRHKGYDVASRIKELTRMLHTGEAIIKGEEA